MEAEYVGSFKYSPDRRHTRIIILNYE
jgi:hypothetical protein